MAKFELKFKDYNDSSTISVKKIEDEKLIEISLYDCLNACEFEGYKESFIWLDKSTAIKLAKTLRTEINKITESEVSNG